MFLLFILVSSIITCMVGYSYPSNFLRSVKAQLYLPGRRTYLLVEVRATTTELWSKNHQLIYHISALAGDRNYSIVLKLCTETVGQDGYHHTNLVKHNIWNEHQIYKSMLHKACFKQVFEFASAYPWTRSGLMSCHRDMTSFWRSWGGMCCCTIWM